MIKDWEIKFIQDYMISQKSNKNATGAKNIYILINSSQKKNATAKNSAGKNIRLQN